MYLRARCETELYPAQDMMADIHVAPPPLSNRCDNGTRKYSAEARICDLMNERTCAHCRKNFAA
jgi:hypothetical protein